MIVWLIVSMTINMVLIYFFSLFFGIAIAMGIFNVPKKENFEKYC